MIWGSQYDAMLRWALKGEDKAKITATGNAAHNLSSVYETGKITIEGKIDRINNIYDLEGNGFEWTTEANGTDYRSYRGGSYSYTYSLASRNDNRSYGTYAYYCSRLTLYIK